MPHPYGWLSLLPPVIAILLAILTRRAIPSLLAGIYCGALITNEGHFVGALYDLLEVHLWPTLIDPSKLRVASFTLLMGGLVGLIIRGGGMRGFVDLIAPLARSRRGGQLTTWLMGLMIFFDDYANTLLLGNTMRAVNDKLRVSREKLAYVVDSTAAPIAGLSLLSTWVAVEIDYIREGLAGIGNPSGFSAVGLFIDSIPYRFYVLGALLMVPLIAWLQRDFGPMLAAERRALQGRSGDAQAGLGGAAAAPLADDPTRPQRAAHWSFAVVPILVTLAVVILLLLGTGKSALRQQGIDPSGEPLRELIGAADSSIALQYGSLCGLLVAMILCRAAGLLDWSAMGRATRHGAALVLPALAILWLASALSRLTGDQPVAGTVVVASGLAEDNEHPHRAHRLYTGAFLSRMIGGDATAGSAGRELTLRLLPTITFLLAGVVAFCTGTSFGTMGMLIPLVLALTHRMLADRGVVSPADPLLLATVGGVLAGAVLGDHCSPISDTTILSSQASGCDHIAHVMTQMPYALTVAAVAVLLGTLPVGWGVSPAVLLPLQAASLFALVRFVGQPVSA